MNCHMTAGLKCHVNIWVELPHHESAACKFWGAMGPVNLQINVFDLSRDHVVDVLCYFAAGVFSS